MRIAVIGTGYVGLVSGACFSEFGVDVVCVDKDADKIRRLKDGKIPIFEPGLEALVESNARAGRLTFSSDLPSAVAGADAVFIAVGTPSRRGDGHADLSYVYAAAEEIGRALTGYAVVVTKSTVPVGTGREVEVQSSLEFARDEHWPYGVGILDDLTARTVDDRTVEVTSLGTSAAPPTLLLHVLPAATIDTAGTDGDLVTGEIASGRWHVVANDGGEVRLEAVDGPAPPSIDRRTPFRSARGRTPPTHSTAAASRSKRARSRSSRPASTLARSSTSLIRSSRC